jgi:hypothetical protein
MDTAGGTFNKEQKGQAYTFHKNELNFNSRWNTIKYNK